MEIFFYIYMRVAISFSIDLKHVNAYNIFKAPFKSDDTIFKKAFACFIYYSKGIS